MNRLRSSRWFEIIGVLVAFETIVLAVSYLIDGELPLETVLLLCIVQIPFVFLGILMLLISYTWGHFQRKRQQVSQIVMIWIWQGKAYLPVLAEVKPGDFAEASPVYAAHLKQADLIAAIESVINTGHQPKPAQVDEEDPLLTATNAVSREELIRQATIFIVQWTREQVDLDVVDAKNDALQRVQSFPADVSLATISTAVLAAVRANDSRFDLTSGSDEIPPERDHPDQVESGGSR